MQISVVSAWNEKTWIYSLFVQKIGQLKISFWKMTRQNKRKIVQTNQTIFKSFKFFAELFEILKFLIPKLALTNSKN